jgi:hypothetical protein
MSTLIVRESLAASLDYIDSDNAVCVHYPSYRICEVWSEIFDIIHGFKSVVLHLGAVDIIRHSPESVLSAFQDLTGKIWEVNPR